MNLFQEQTSLLDTNLPGDAFIPADEVLQALGQVAVYGADIKAWSVGLRKLLIGLSSDDSVVEHLAGLQFLASVGAPAGARLLAGFWEQIDLATWADPLAGNRDLEPLLELVLGRASQPLDLARLATGAHRTVSLAAQMKAAGLRSHGMDLLTAAVLVQSNYGNGQVVLAVDPALSDGLAGILKTPRPWDGDFEGSLAGVSLFESLLVIETEPGSDVPFVHGFPVLIRGVSGPLPEVPASAPEPEAAEVGDAAAEKEIDNSRLKKLVLDNIMSTSVLLEFLRDPKVFSIPGLIEEVVDRTRNPQIIETVANTRVLHTGFANKGVPLACLRSPVNVSVRTLRKFVHVKYVPKIDLKHLANDRTGVRKEVSHEITRYLESLS